MIKVLQLLLISFVASAAFADSLYKDGSPAVAGGVEKSVNMPNFTALAKVLSPAVVNVAVESSTAPDNDDNDQSEAPPFPFFKKDQAIPMSSMGSGFIIREDGYIVTNYHVIKEAKSIVIRLLDDKTEYPAKLVGQDPLTDLALIKMEPKAKLPIAYLGDSDSLEVGEWVLAIGNQFQLGQTVTAGIVSAKSRRVGGSPSRPYDQFIQTDAPINPGSSGGPLFNTKGQVIGINTAIFSPGRSAQLGGAGFNIGIGFSVPINLAKSVIPQLKDQGKVTRGLLGVLIQEIDQELAAALKLESTDGALVSDVKKDSPAERAGFRRRDVIVSFNGKPIKEHTDLPLMVANTKIGSEASVEVMRGGEKIILKPVVGELKDDADKKSKEKVNFDSLGLVVKHITDEIAKELAISVDSGVEVDKVQNNSAGEKAKLIKGDIIQELANIPIKDVLSFEKVASELKKGEPVTILVRRKDGAFYMVIKAK